METDATNDNFEERRKSILDLLRRCMDKIEKDFPGKSHIVKTGMAVRAILEIEGITLPFMLVIIGPPSAGKTTVLSMIESLPDSYTLDSFTPNAFVSHYAGRKTEELAKNDLLTQIKDKAFLVFDLAPLFSGKEENLTEIIGILTRVLDGKGYKKSSGVYGERGHGPTFFVLIGATADVSKNVWPLIAKLGPKMFFLRIDMQMSYEEEQQKILGSMNSERKYEQKLEEVNACLREYWDALKLFLAPNGNKITWDAAKDQPGIMLRIVEYAQLLARLRGYIPTDKTDGTGGSNYGYLEPRIEDPERAALYLYNMGRGNAVCHARNYVIWDDLSVLRPLVWSSAPKERGELLKVLIKYNGEMTSANLAEERKITKSTALKIMKELEILGIVDEVMVPGTTKDFKAIRLKEQFRWILEKGQNE